MFWRSSLGSTKAREGSDSGTADPEGRPVGRPITPEERIVFRFRQELARYCDRSDPAQVDAYHMAYNGIIGLVTKAPGSLELARRWNAWCRGAGPDGPNSQALAIADLAHCVAIAACLRQRPDEQPDAVYEFRENLVARFGDSIPPVGELEALIDSLAPVGRKGRGLTVETIVARIMCRGRLLGAGSDERKVRDRVKKALKRHHGF
jgi:hypothetical protein